MSEDRTYITTGTTDPVYISSTASTMIVPGQTYFIVKIKSAQAAFHGPIWQRAQQLVVTSQVDLNLKTHPTLSEPVQAIQHSRKIDRNRAEKLGISPNLINLVPATMSHITISIDYILDVKNSLATLGALINDEAFLSVISLAPGAAVAARTISGLSQKIIQSFMEPEERKPILQFRGDFNIASQEVREGYYVILGTRDKRCPIPRPLPTLEVQEGDLLADGSPVTQWSYVVLEVRTLPARTRHLNDGAEWEQRLREAEDEALAISHDPLADDEQRRLAWNRCLELLQEAQVLLRADSNYLTEEASKIVIAAYNKCHRQILGTEPVSTTHETVPVRGKGMLPIQTSDARGRRRLGFPEDANLSAIASQYESEVEVAQKVIEREGVR
jgi:hypothetical protein